MPPLLVLRGPYLRVRHPAYVGTLMCLLGVALATSAAVALLVVGTAAIVTALLIVIEERALLARYGEAYRRYRAAVPAVLPLRYKSRSLPTADV